MLQGKASILQMKQSSQSGIHFALNHGKHVLCWGRFTTATPINFIGPWSSIFASWGSWRSTESNHHENCHSYPPPPSILVTWNTCGVISLALSHSKSRYWDATYKMNILNYIVTVNPFVSHWKSQKDLDWIVHNIGITQVRNNLWAHAKHGNCQHHSHAINYSLTFLMCISQKLQLFQLKVSRFLHDIRVSNTAWISENDQAVLAW